MMNKIDKACSVAFTGHRSIPLVEIERVRGEVRKKVRLLYTMGFRNYLCGMAIGFDMLAAEEVIKLRNEGYNSMRFVAVVPFRGQNSKWSDTEKSRYNDVLNNADEVIILSEHYYNGCFLRRNDYMLSHACGLIAYFNGQPKGGTFYTISRAKKMNIDIVNIF